MELIMIHHGRRDMVRLPQGALDYMHIGAYAWVIEFEWDARKAASNLRKQGES